LKRNRYRGKAPARLLAIPLNPYQGLKHRQPESTQKNGQNSQFLLIPIRD